MAFRYKINVLAVLKERGYSSTRLRNEHLLGESYMSQLRRGEMVSWAALETICTLLDCQPGDLLEHVSDEIPNAETQAAIDEVNGMIQTGSGEHFAGSTEELFKKILSEPDEATGK